MEILITLKNAHQPTNQNEICNVKCLDTDAIIYLKKQLIQQKCLQLDPSDITLLNNGQETQDEEQIKNLNIEQGDCLLYKLLQMNHIIDQEKSLNYIYMRLYDMGFEIDINDENTNIILKHDYNLEYIIPELFPETQLILDDVVEQIYKFYPDFLQIIQSANLQSIYEKDPEQFSKQFISYLQKHLESYPDILTILNQNPKEFIDSVFRVIKNRNQSRFPIIKPPQKVAYTNEEVDQFKTLMKDYKISEQEVISSYKLSNRKFDATKQILEEKQNFMEKVQNPPEPAPKIITNPPKPALPEKKQDSDDSDIDIY